MGKLALGLHGTSQVTFSKFSSCCMEHFKLKGLPKASKNLGQDQENVPKTAISCLTVWKKDKEGKPVCPVENKYHQRQMEHDRLPLVSVCFSSSPAVNE